MVSNHLYHYIYYDSLHNGQFMFFSPSLFNYLGMGFENFPLFSHHATLTSACHSLVRHYCFMPLIVYVLL